MSNSRLEFWCGLVCCRSLQFTRTPSLLIQRFLSLSLYFSCFLMPTLPYYHSNSLSIGLYYPQHCTRNPNFTEWSHNLDWKYVCSYSSHTTSFLLCMLNFHSQTHMNIKLTLNLLQLLNYLFTDSLLHSHDRWYDWEIQSENWIPTLNYVYLRES